MPSTAHELLNSGFKRVQNQSLDGAIRRKAIGDLGKALALKEAGLWDVAAWTFISNYPMPESIGRQLIAMGGVRWGRRVVEKCVVPCRCATASSPCASCFSGIADQRDRGNAVLAQRRTVEAGHAAHVHGFRCATDARGDRSRPARSTRYMGVPAVCRPTACGAS